MNSPSHTGTYTHIHTHVHTYTPWVRAEISQKYTGAWVYYIFSSVSMYKHICIYIYMHTYTVPYAYISAYVWMFEFMCIYICTVLRHVALNTPASECVAFLLASTFMYTHIYMLTYTQRRVYIRVCTHKYRHMYLYIYVHTDIYTYTRVCIYKYVAIYLYIYVHIYITHTAFLVWCHSITQVWHLNCTQWRRPIGCLKLQVFFAKEPLIIGFFCGKWPIKIRHPMGLRHPVICIHDL